MREESHFFLHLSWVILHVELLHIILPIVAKAFNVFDVITDWIEDDFRGIVEEDTAASIR
jgi:hypothetical protein